MRKENMATIIINELELKIAKVADEIKEYSKRYNAEQIKSLTLKRLIDIKTEELRLLYLLQGENEK